MVLVLRRPVACRPRVGLAHTSALLRVIVEATPMRTDNIKVVDMRDAVNPDDRVRRALRAGLLL